MADEEPFHILLVNDHLGWEGEVLHGVAQLFRTWVPELEKRGHRVTVCILRERDDLHHHLSTEGIEVTFLGRSKFDPRTLPDLIRLVREAGVDVIHAQGYGGMNFGRLASLLTGTPVVTHIHDRSTEYPWYQWVADGLLNWSSEATITVSESVKQHLLRHRNTFGLRSDAIKVWYNCILTEQFKAEEIDQSENLREELNLPADSPVVGTVTRLHPDKGNRFLIEAAHQIRSVRPQARVVIVGEGPERESLEQMVRKKNLDEVVLFTGFRDDVPRLLSLFDIFVLSSRREGSPMALLEAMAMGKAVVTSDVVDVVEHGNTGLIVPTADSSALAAAILELLEDDSRKEKLGKAAKVRSEEFDVENYAERMVRLYQSLIS